MKTTRTSWKFFLGYGIKHVSETDVWTIWSMPDWTHVATETSLQRARKKIFRELPLKQ